MKKILLIIIISFISLTAFGCKKEDTSIMTITEFINEMNNEQTKFAYNSKITSGLSTTAIVGNLDSGVVISKQNGQSDFVYGKFLFGEQLKMAYASISSDSSGLILSNQISILMYYGISMYSLELEEEDFSSSDNFYKITLETFDFKISFEHKKAIISADNNTGTTVDTIYDFSTTHKVYDGFRITENAVYYIDKSNIYLLNSLTNSTDFEFDQIEGKYATHIGANAFYASTNLEEIILPNSIKEIGYSAFSNCIRIQQITLNNGLEVIKESSFENCYLLTELIIPTTVTTIGKNILSSQYYCTIYTSLSEKPSGWNENFNNGYEVVYNYNN